MTERPDEELGPLTDNDSPGVVVPPPLMFLAAIGVGILFDGNLLDWRHALHPAQFTGLAIGMVGLALILVSLGLFRRFKTRPEPWEASSTLIRTGLYRFSRNPMYLGMAATSAGIAIFFESIAAGALLILVVLIVDRAVIAREEAYLTRRFGAPYVQYRKQVRRWL